MLLNNFPTVTELYSSLCDVIPPELSLPWDNDGLMLSASGNNQVKKVLLSLDVTRECVEYAKEVGADLIITHHPLIFKAIKSIVSPIYTELIKNNISVMSFHTRLDIVEGGINDMLAGILGLRNVQTFAEGAGRIGALEYVWDFDDYRSYVGELLDATALKWAKATDTSHIVAIVSGSGGDFAAEAIERGADTFISGEIGYHTMLDSSQEGLNLIAAGHYHTECHFCNYFKSYFDSNYPSIEYSVFNRNVNY